MVCGIAKAAKADHQCEAVSRLLPPVRTVAHIAKENVSIEPWTYFSCPNAGMGVTSLCQICKALRPRGVTHNCGGALWPWQWEQELTMWRASEFDDINCLYRAHTRWWKKARQAFACARPSGCGTVQAGLTKWSARALPSAMKPRRSVWSLTCKIE